MNILLTNDDGIDSDGIVKLAEHLRSHGKHRVFVVAPDTNRSGISNALSILNGPVKMSSLGEDTWSCSGYPSDCVIAGIKLVYPVQLDLVLSGINRGENLGTDIIYSGTASAARQGSLIGIPGIALSLAASDAFCWDIAASWAVDHLEELLAYWKKDAFVNVNIPNCSSGPEGIISSWPAAKKYKDTLSEMTTRGGSRFFLLEAGENPEVCEAGSDCDIVSRNYVSVSTIYNYPAIIRETCPHAPSYAAVSDRNDKRE